MGIPSKKVNCPKCGKKVRARGLYGHLKLKHGLVLSKTTRVIVNTPLNSSPTPSEINSSGASLMVNSSNKLIPEPEGYRGLAGLEKDRLSFTPSHRDWINYCDGNPDDARKQWMKLCEVKKKYSWVIFFNSYKHLSRIFDLENKK